MSANDTAHDVEFDEFRNGLSRGRFRVIVNPQLAPRFVAYQVHANAVALAIIGPGIALALAGWPWVGAALVAAGILFRRAVKWQAAHILLHLAARVRAVYEAATEHGVMEVQRT